MHGLGGPCAEALRTTPPIETAAEGGPCAETPLQALHYNVP